MADTKMIPVNPDFDMVDLVTKLTQMYQAQGFEVSAIQAGTGVSIKFSKDDDGVKKFVGLALGITANISMGDNNTLSNSSSSKALIINFSGAEWLGKIVGLAIGWVLCLIPFVIAGYGAIKQSELPKKIGNDIQTLVVGGTVPFGR